MNFDLVIPFLWYVVFVFSVTFHEAAHAWAAMKGGDMTAYLGGQVSLDPIPHIRREPIGMLIVPLASVFLTDLHIPIGWASTPYNQAWAMLYPRRSAWMALAGPMSNLILVFVSMVIVWICLLQGLFVIPSPEDLVLPLTVVKGVEPGFIQNFAMLVGMLFFENVLLSVLNMIPLPPFDGSSAITLLMTRRMGEKFRAFAWNPAFSMMGIIVAIVIFPRVFWPVYIFIVKILYPWIW